VAEDVTMEALRDRLAITDAIHAWCTAIDSRNWRLMREILADTVAIDYSSNGSSKADYSAEAWIERLHVLHGFDATLHMVSNLVVEIAGDSAVCTSYVNALHFLKDSGQEFCAHGCGVYRHTLKRSAKGWMINGATFTVAGRMGGWDSFDIAFARARELAPQRMKQAMA
jgi:hypothetical protein